MALIVGVLRSTSWMNPLANAEDVTLPANTVQETRYLTVWSAQMTSRILDHRGFVNVQQGITGTTLYVTLAMLTVTNAQDPSLTTA